MAEAMVPLNRSLDVDIRLWPQDVRGSRAWARALVKAGVLEEDEGVTLLEGLTAWPPAFPNATMPMKLMRTFIP